MLQILPKACAPLLKHSFCLCDMNTSFLYQKAFGISHTVVCGVVTDDWQEKCSAASFSMLPAANLHYQQLRIQKHLFCVSNCSHSAKLSSVSLWRREGWYERCETCLGGVCSRQIGSVFHRSGYAFICVPQTIFPWGYLLLGIIGSTRKIHHSWCFGEFLTDTHSLGIDWCHEESMT